MLTAWELVATVLLPGATAALLAVAGCRVTRHQYSARASRTWAGPAAVGTGFIAGWLALFGWTGLPPHDAVDWLLPLALPLVLLGSLDALGWVPPPARVLAIALAVPACFLLVAWPVLTRSGDPGFPWQLVAAIGLAVVPLVALDTLSAQVTAGRQAVLLFLVAGPAAIVLGCSSSARLGLIGLILASALAGLVAASVVLGRAGRGRGITLVAGTLLATLLWSSRIYANLDGVDALLLAIAPCLAWLGPRMTRRYGWLAHLAVQGGSVLAVSSLAAVRAWLELRQSGL